jgi:DNA repair exonuclease SbcCD ATPase subunit
MEFSGKFSFPDIENVKIRSFTLYSKNGNVSAVNEKINNGVFCLAGANGLGKTTFLNILNYGLTGLVLEPDKTYSIPSEIISSNYEYTERYFGGRVHASERENAEVEIVFSVSNVKFRISRNFFKRTTLNCFEIFIEKDGNIELIFSGNSYTPSEREELYKNKLTEYIGIGDFNYYIFYQLYVLTFDENRRMIFWNERAATTTFSLAFNEDLYDAQKVLDLKKRMDELESHGRNARWQATQIKNERENLISARKQKELINYDKLKNEFDKLNGSIDKKRILFDNITVEYDTLLKRQNILNSDILQQRSTYNQLFSAYSEPRSKLVENKYVKYSIDKGSCFICGAEGNHVAENIQKKIHELNCPLCNTNINESHGSDQSELIEDLKRIDVGINEKTKDLEKLIVESRSKEVELEKADQDLIEAEKRLKVFLGANSSMSFDDTGDLPIDQLLRDYKHRFDELDRKSKDYYNKRDKLRPEYDSLIDKISNAYDDAKKYFVPLFKDIARSFIGYDLNIHFKRRGREVMLNFEMRGSARTESTQLSESQRFFLDIALRMALIIYLSRKSEPGTLFIDTPEGSLDVAYESRVGKMFAKFVKDYHQNIIMTANINASQLLLSLAEQCGNEYMVFRRMLDWTDLSEIQIEGESLFEKVFNSIESALK